MSKDVTICIPTIGIMSYRFVNSLIGAMFSPHTAAMQFKPRLPIDQARTELAKKVETDWLLFVDDDMVFTPEDIDALVKADKPIVSGLFYRRSPFKDKVVPVGFRKKKGELKWITDAPSELSKVDATGLAFTLIKTEVFEKIGYDFKFKDGVGEDINFCLDARQAGYPIYIEPKARVGHLTEHAV